MGQRQGWIIQSVINAHVIYQYWTSSARDKLVHVPSTRTYQLWDCLCRCWQGRGMYMYLCTLFCLHRRTNRSLVSFLSFKVDNSFFPRESLHMSPLEDVLNWWRGARGQSRGNQFWIVCFWGQELLEGCGICKSSSNNVHHDVWNILVGLGDVALYGNIIVGPPRPPCHIPVDKKKKLIAINLSNQACIGTRHWDT